MLLSPDTSCELPQSSDGIWLGTDPGNCYTTDLPLEAQKIELQTTSSIKQVWGRYPEKILMTSREQSSRQIVF